MEYTTHSEEETLALAGRFAEKVRPGTMIALNGDMGAGKTVFARGFARGLGITERIQSPTFTILQVYESGRLPLYHFDVYRLAPQEETLVGAKEQASSPEAEEALLDIGCEEYFDGDGVCLVEWADLVARILPQDAIRIWIGREEGQEETRVIKVEAPCASTLEPFKFEPGSRSKLNVSEKG